MTGRSVGPFEGARDAKPVTMAIPDALGLG